MKVARRSFLSIILGAIATLPFVGAETLAREGSQGSFVPLENTLYYAFESPDGTIDYRIGYRIEPAKDGHGAVLCMERLTACR